MKKIGILTFHRSHNYGAVLQAYASQEMLIKMQYEVEIIDYLPKSKVSWYSPYPRFKGNYHDIITVLRYIKNCLCNPSLRFALHRRWNAFNTFIENMLNLSHTESLTKFPKDINKYDIIYIGSDQVWRKLNAQEGYEYYWGNFGLDKENPKCTKVISYGASMETKMINNNEVELHRKNLKNFDSISVRESFLKQILQPLTDKNISIVLDPTLLLDKADYNKIMSEKSINKDYVLLYGLESENLNSAAKKIANKYRLEIIEIGMSGNDKVEYEIRNDASPSEFLRLFCDATYIVTNSFHGTAFSLIFEKSFCALKTSTNTRVESLLKQLEIDKICYIDDVASFNLDDASINYVQVNKHLKNLRAQSLEYIQQSCI